MLRGGLSNLNSFRNLSRLLVTRKISTNISPNNGTNTRCSTIKLPFNPHKLNSGKLNTASIRSFSTSTSGKKSKTSIIKIASLLGLVILLGLSFINRENPHFTRPLAFWRQVTPIYLHYKYVESIIKFREKITSLVENDPNIFLGDFLRSFAFKDKKAERDAAFNYLHAKYATNVFHIITSLKGYYIKLGQFGSLRPDVLPPQWIVELEKLQSEAPFEDFETVMGLIKEGLGRDPSEIFTSIEPVPLGAASVGQVHKATLFNGQEVVIKIQYPDVETTFKIDMQVIKSFCALAQPEQLTPLAEIERQFLTEFDYTLEANHLENIHHNMKNSPYRDDVVVPLPLREYCSQRVLTMEYLPGQKMVDVLRDTYTKIAHQQNKTLEELMYEHRHTPAPSSLAVKFYNVYFATLDAVCNSSIFLYNNTVGWFANPLSYVKHTAPLDIHHIVDILSSAHAHQMLINGYFNADCHPGNVLLMEQNKLGLIDMGQVKVLDLKTRAILARMFLAFEESNNDELVKVYLCSGTRTKHNHKDILYKIAQLSFNYDDEETRGGLNIEQFFKRISEIDPIVLSDDQLVMASRLCLLLRGVATTLHYPIKVSSYFAPISKDFLNQHPQLNSWVDDFVVKIGYIQDNNLYGTSEEAVIMKEMTDLGNNIANMYATQK